ncbi:MAG: ATP-binding protein [Gemmatimonadota bacterium]|nr:ATP-binding protein [Gemmatimonadota bacterium]
MEHDLVLEIPTDVRSIEHAVDYVMERCRTCETYQKRLRVNFRVGLTEALTNAMLYGNEYDPSKRVRVEVTLEGGRLEARVTDQGRGFDPSTIPDPTEPENILKSGGRGLFLMRQLLDEVSYNDQGNQVTLVLRLEQGSALEGGAQA